MIVALLVSHVPEQAVVSHPAFPWSHDAVGRLSFKGRVRTVGAYVAQRLFFSATTMAFIFSPFRQTYRYLVCFPAFI